MSYKKLVVDKEYLMKFPKFQNFSRFTINSLSHYYTLKNVKNQDFFQKLCSCLLIKSNGNDFFKQERFEEAAVEYEKVKTPFK